MSGIEHIKKIAIRTFANTKARNHSWGRKKINKVKLGKTVPKCFKHGQLLWPLVKK